MYTELYSTSNVYTVAFCVCVCVCVCERESGREGERGPFTERLILD